MRLSTLLVITACLPSCAFLQKAADMHKDACEVLGEEHHDELQPQVEAHAQRVGISVVDAWKLWHASCQARHIAADNVAIGAAGAELCAGGMFEAD